MIWIIHYLRKSIIFFSVPAALLSACSGADDLAVNEPHGQSPKASSSQVKAPTANPVSYTALQIEMIQPEAIFPQIKQIEAWDPKIYEYVEDLRVAEAYVMRDMMAKYGAGKYSPEEYQQLLSKVTIGLIGEKPNNYQDYERIWPAYTPANIDDHGNNTFENLISLKWKQTKIMNLSSKGDGRAKNLSEYAKTHPNDLFIFSSSTSTERYTHKEFDEIFNQDIIDLCNLPNVIIFVAWGDTQTINWVIIKKVYNGIYNSNWDWLYNNSSMANSDKNNYPNSNMRVVIWTDSKWNADMTNSKGSVFPIGSNKNSIVSGHPILPFYLRKDGIKWKLFGQDLPRNWSYTTSNTTPTKASEIQLMFGLRADVADADELLQMVEGSLADPDYISLNGEKQALQKYSPANFIKKYLMPENLPTELSINETKELSKGSYMGVVFNILGAEVLIDGEWTACTEQNATKIKAQNPFTLEWRLNGDLCQQYGKKTGDVIEGTIILVDDQWNGLSITLPFSVTLTDTSTGIRPVYAD